MYSRQIVDEVSFTIIQSRPTYRKRINTIIIDYDKCMFTHYNEAEITKLSFIDLTVTF